MMTKNLYAEAVRGDFEIAVGAAGEYWPRIPLDIKAPEMAQGRDFHAADIKIQDLVPEGTVVREGDYIATLDRTHLIIR